MFKFFDHFNRCKLFLMKYFPIGDKLKGLPLAIVAIIFSALLFFIIAWTCTFINSVISSRTMSGGSAGAGIFSGLGTLKAGLGSIIGFSADEPQAGIHFAKHHVESNYLTRNRPRKLIIDTDGGVDDAIAVFMVLSETLRPVKVLAITTVMGHTDVEGATKNILRTLKVLEKDREVPIYMGTTVGILKYPDSKGEREYYFGYEGYGETGYEGPSIDDLPKYHAVLAIIDAVKKYPGEVTIFCMGPLTNIALAVRLYPQFVRDVHRIYVLGGSVYRLEAMDSTNEFNFQQDPEALKIVFDERLQLKQKIYFISWENVSQMSVPLDWRVNVLGKSKSEKMRIINIMEEKMLGKMKKEKKKKWISPGAILAELYLEPPYSPIKPEVKRSIAAAAAVATATASASNKALKNERNEEVDSTPHFIFSRVRFKNRLMRTLS